MNALISGIDVLLSVLRVGFFGAAVALTVICGIDWAVRTRRINPFSGVARFFRQTIDPLLAPVERRLVRSGGLPSNAPWWALAGVVLGGIVIISLIGFVEGQLQLLTLASGAGTPGLLKLIVHWAFAVLQVALIARVLSSWIRVSPYSRWIRWAFVLTEPILAPLRRIIPTIGMIDITPIIAYFLLQLLERALLGSF